LFEDFPEDASGAYCWRTDQMFLIFVRHKALPPRPDLHGHADQTRFSARST
jgi:hypothetical protein